MLSSVYIFILGLFSHAICVEFTTSNRENLLNGPKTTLSADKIPANPTCPRSKYSADIRRMTNNVTGCLDPTSPPVILKKAECMGAFDKFNFFAKNYTQPAKYTDAHACGSCFVHITSSLHLHHPTLRYVLSDVDGLGFEALIDTCCPNGLAWTMIQIDRKQNWYKAYVRDRPGGVKDECLKQ
ncbi:hypothetical protein O181_059072 [Austropuccinia psidii MF-1]|uniref:Uncharacterized protein n=1 Tax=Austropuccinia psidii MF-1 TaxID=1389203 RepID=A0A9Q3HX29_9BASI|nr:hypothetical protein [Austropuccinia psidii MF-1]